MVRHTSSDYESIESLKAFVAQRAGSEWTPGKWGKRFSLSSNWVAAADHACLRIDSDERPFEHIRTVDVRRGLVWASVVVKFDDRSKKVLRGLTNRNAATLARQIRAACDLHSIERLKILLSKAEHQRERLDAFLDRPRWISQSDLSQFMASFPAPSPASDLRQFLENDSARSARRFLSQEQEKMLSYHLSSSSVPDLKARNKWFLDEEIKRYREFFDTVKKNPLTDEQREAVVTFDDNVMTVAAAGSGKTSVLIAKAGYAVATGLFEPEEIVLLAFNRKAAEELKERVEERLGSRVKGADKIRVATFHSLGLDVISAATGERPKIAPWIEENKELAELVDIVRTLSADRQFASKWNLFRTVYARSLPAFGSVEEPEAWDPETGVLGFRTLRGETVRSQEERMICDWLAQEGIAYEYERPYEYDTATSTHRQYMPDFYYPSANAYHEHFALDENGRPPRHFAGYADGVEWKRNLHEERGTTLIETTSHAIRSEGGFEQFRDDLDSVGVRFSEVTLQDDPLARVSEEASLLRVFRTFMSHVKSNQLTMADLRARATSRRSEHAERDRLFLEIFEELWREWDRRLAHLGAVDFEDMLVLAAEHLAAGRCRMPYRLVMADEFQDSSRIRGTMLRELTSDPDSRLYVVGDDWQAVNRFAGADISLMREFDKLIGPYSMTQLTWTFRCPADICDIAGTFVVQNPYQLKKKVRAMNKRPAPNVFCFELEEFEKQESMLRSHLLQLAHKIRDSNDDTRVSAYVLGRYRSDKPANLSEIAAEVSDTVDLHWSTIHASKGLEADYVFLVNVIEGTKGLPSKIEDDSTLWIAMPDGETFSYAEERRLFYVALTRAKRMVFIYTDTYRRSEFIAELERQNTGMQVRIEGTGGKKKRRCPSCDSGLLITRSGKFGEFLSCSRFPRCDYTENIRRECPGCGDGTLVAREGKFGIFLSCSRFPRCEYSESPKKPRKPH